MSTGHHHKRPGDDPVDDSTASRQPPEPELAPDTTPAATSGAETSRKARRQSQAPKPARPNPEPENTGTAADNWRRLKHAGRVKWTKSQVLTGVLCALLGFALVAQIQQTEERGLAQLSQAELVRVLDDVDSRNARLESEARQLQQSEEELRSGNDQQRAAREQAEQRSQDLAILAGTVAVEGPGVEITVNKPGMNSADVVTMMQELRDAGAEAVEIGGHRVVVNTWFANDADRNLLVNGKVTPMPLHIKAIGEPETIATAMKIPGGVSDTIEQGGGTITISTRAQVSIDAVIDHNVEREK